LRVLYFFIHAYFYMHIYKFFFFFGKKFSKFSPTNSVTLFSHTHS
jgi:hypothetical protein